MTIKVHIDRSWARRGWDIYICQERGDAMDLFYFENGGWMGREIESPLPFEPGPSLFLRDEWATALTEALLSHGVRPDIEARNEGELTAAKAHLADLEMLLELRLKPCEEAPCPSTTPTPPSR